MSTPLDQIGEESEMSFLDHLEELRWHLIRGLIAIAVFSIVAFLFPDFIFGKILLGPRQADFWTFQKLCQLGEFLSFPSLCFSPSEFTIQSRQMTGQFTMHITSSFVVGIIVAFPYFFWEIWRFIRPGLYPKEKKATRGAVFYVSFLFLTGVFFGYYIATPISIKFLADYQIDPSFINEFDIISYVSTVMTLVLASGLLFQLPIVVYFLSKAGIVTPTLLKSYRRHAIVVILILGAMITPPDPFSQILIALPLFILYEVGIIISGRVHRRKEKQLTKQLEENE
ncbi:MAG: twin-arginine translocase subunit TatC [bacterium]|nr:twin-arginine translocase subunit TatC [bacterium]